MTSSYNSVSAILTDKSIPDNLKRAISSSYISCNSRSNFIDLRAMAENPHIPDEYRRMFVESLEISAYYVLSRPYTFFHSIRELLSPLPSSPIELLFLLQQLNSIVECDSISQYYRDYAGEMMVRILLEQKNTERLKQLAKSSRLSEDVRYAATLSGLFLKLKARKMPFCFHRTKRKPFHPSNLKKTIKTSR